MQKVIQTLDEMVRDGVIEDYVIGGATALLYFSIPHFITEDVDVFVYLKNKPTSSIIDVSPIYNYLLTKRSARVEGEYVIVDGFPLQFLTPYDDLSKEAFADAIHITAENMRFKIFSLEHSMAIMIQLGKEKYIERLRTLVRYRLFDEPKLNSLLERFSLTSKWALLKRRLETNQ
jgi:predicted nucleotidyltransferase